MIEDDDLPQELLKSMMQETMDDKVEIQSPAEQSIPILHQVPHPLGNFAEIVCRNLESHFANALKSPTKIQFQGGTVSQFENLNQLADGRSYYSQFVIEKPRSVWVLHVQRSVAEGLASVLRDPKKSGMDFRFSEADAVVYLDIGHFLQDSIHHIIQSGFPNRRLKVLQIRHMLNPKFNRLADGEETYQVLKFAVQHPVAAGVFQVAIPDSVSRMLHQ